MWLWLCHYFATFVTASQGVKVQLKTASTHLHPLTHLLAYQPSNSCIATCSAARSLPPFSQRHSSTPHNTTVKLSELWESLHVLCGMPCGPQVPPALTVLCGSSEEEGVMRSVRERVQVWVCSINTVESESIWTVGNYFLLLLFWLCGPVHWIWIKYQWS